MRTGVLKGRGGLVLLNAALLVALAAISWVPSADAQNQPGRNPGEYTMVAGRTVAGGNSAVYIVDSANQEVVALRWDQGKAQLLGLGYRNIAGDGKAAAPGR